MSAAQTSPVVDKGRRRHSLIIGVILIILAVFTAWVFGYGTTGEATFRLAMRGDSFKVGDLVVPAAPYAYVVATILAFFGARLMVRSGSRRANLILGIGLILFITAFLTWATADHSFSLTGMLKSTIVRALPIAFGGLTGVLCERVAVINIGIEGMLLAGAFSGVVFGSLFGGWAGLAGASLTGGLLGLVLAVLTVTYRMDQIIAGVVINIFVLGLTSYLTSQLLAKEAFRHLNDAPVFRPIDIPYLSDFPIIGPLLFQHNIFVYAAFAMVVIATYYLFHTRTGLRARAVGEHPRAADTLGINVLKMRYIQVTIAGMVAGFGGAWFTLGSVGRFDENMTSGRGFIGLAAMIFGRWHPVGALAAALVFGFADSVQQKMALLRTPIPSEFLAMAPYVATIIVVAGLVGRARPPAADGKPYVKE